MCFRVCVLTCGLDSAHTKQPTEGNEGSQTEDEAARWGLARRRDLRAGKRSGGEAGRQPEVGVKRAD